MNFLLITNNDTDGIGQTVVNLFNNLKKNGHSAQILTLHKFYNDKDIVKIKRSFFFRLFFYSLNFLKKNFNELFWFNISSINFSTISNYIKNCDVIIIFTFQKLISTKILNKIFKYNKIVFLRPLDMEIISGGCHFNGNCNRYMKACLSCPKIYFDNFLHLAAKNLEDKKKIIERFKPKVIVQNTFVKSLVKKSYLLNYSDPKIIPVGVNQERSKYYSKNEARKKLGLPLKEKIILFITYNLSSYNKGGHLLIKSLEILEKKYFFKKKKNNKINLLTIGNCKNFSLNLNYIKHLNAGIIHSDHKLNLYYRAADILVSPSIFDFGPHVVNEAISNDLPVVAFKVGTANDVIKDSVNGYLIKCFDTKEYSLAIKKLLDKKKLKNKKLRSKIKEKRSVLAEASSIIKISSECLSESKL